MKYAIITLGEKGAMVVTESECRLFPALSVKAVDTTGAGDAFNAGMATALAWGASLEEAVELANVMGGLAVTKEGVIPSLPGCDEVVECYRHRGVSPPAWLANSPAAAR